MQCEYAFDERPARTLDPNRRATTGIQWQVTRTITITKILLLLLWASPTEPKEEMSKCNGVSLLTCAAGRWRGGSLDRA